MRSLIIASLLLLTPVAATAAQPTPNAGFSCATLAARQALPGASMSFRVLKLTFANTSASVVHRHKFGEIVYLLSGSGTNTMNGTTTALSADRSIFIPAGTNHNIEPTNGGPLTVLSVQFLATGGAAWDPSNYKGPDQCKG